MRLGLQWVQEELLVHHYQLPLEQRVAQLPSFPNQLHLAEGDASDVAAPNLLLSLLPRRAVRQLIQRRLRHQRLIASHLILQDGRRHLAPLIRAVWLVRVAAAKELHRKLISGETFLLNQDLLGYVVEPRPVAALENRTYHVSILVKNLALPRALPVLVRCIAQSSRKVAWR